LDRVTAAAAAVVLVLAVAGLFCWTRKRVGFALGGNAAVMVCLLGLGVDTFIGTGRKAGKKKPLKGGAGLRFVTGQARCPALAGA